MQHRLKRIACLTISADSTPRDVGSRRHSTAKRRGLMAIGACGRRFQIFVCSRRIPHPSRPIELGPSNERIRCHRRGRRHTRRRRAAGHGGGRLYRIAHRDARARQRHLEPLEQIDPRRSSLSRVRSIRAGAREPARTRHTSAYRGRPGGAAAVLHSRLPRHAPPALAAQAGTVDVRAPRRLRAGHPLRRGSQARVAGPRRPRHLGPHERHPLLRRADRRRAADPRRGAIGAGSGRGTRDARAIHRRGAARTREWW